MRTARSSGVTGGRAEIDPFTDRTRHGHDSGARIHHAALHRFLPSRRIGWNGDRRRSFSQPMSARSIRRSCRGRMPGRAPGCRVGRSRSVGAKRGRSPPSGGDPVEGGGDRIGGRARSTTSRESVRDHGRSPARTQVFYSLRPPSRRVKSTLHRPVTAK